MQGEIYYKFVVWDKKEIAIMAQIYGSNHFLKIQ